MALARLSVILASFATGAAAQGTSPPAAPPALPPPACMAPEHRQFDFWVGYWDVYPTGKDKLVAHSLIERLYDGCAIRENWIPLKLPGGGSLNTYRPEQKVWRQIWVDSGNAWGVFEGKFENGVMILSGDWENINGPGTKAFARTTWTRNPDGSVRQLGETRNADGKTWTVGYGFTYRKSGSASPN